MPEQKSVSTDHSGAHLLPGVEFGQVVARAAGKSHDLGGLTRPLLEALAKLASLDSTYLTTLDWERRLQVVRFVHSAGELQVEEGQTVALPEGLTPESLPGVTRSPARIPKQHPDSQVAKQLGLKTYISVPVTVAKHRMYGMLCGASQVARPVGENVVTVMEFFAQIIADHITREQTAAMEERALTAEERLRSRAQFLAEAEHQLKTPLSTIQGMASLLLSKWASMKDHQRTELLTTLVRDSKELTRQVEDLLVEARADVQAREMAPIRLELGPLVRAIAGAFGSTSTTHDVVAEVEEGTMALADPTPLYQVLGNLLDNAIKYSPDGGTITLRVVPTPHDVRIDVIDDGVGLPDGVHIFEPFRRGELREDDEPPGVGLGLHIVRSLVEAMDGSVDARTNEDGGSTFTVRLPKA